MFALELSAVDRGAEGSSRVLCNPTLQLTQRPTPVLQNDGQLLLKIISCGICGSDLHCVTGDDTGRIAFTGPLTVPVVLGHEIVGEVIDSGRLNRKAFPVGALVVVDSVVSCSQCVMCLAGHPNQCLKSGHIGLTMDGGFAEHMLVDAAQCHRAEALIDRWGEKGTSVGVLVEPMACVHNALRNQLQAGTPPVAEVIGCGPIGLAAVFLLKHFGVQKVLASDPIAERVCLAEELGAIATLGSQAGSDVDDVDDVDDVELIVEASGDEAGFAHGVRHLGQRGTLILLGRLPRQLVLEPNRLISGARVIRGSRGPSGYGAIQAVMRVLEAASVEMLTMVGPRFGLRSYESAFTAAQSRRYAKVTIEP